jgi:acyl carrier protein
LGLAFSEWPTVQQGFFEMGMDSLMAVELKNRLAKHLGMTLPNTLIFDYPNLHKLAHYSVSRLGSIQTFFLISILEPQVPPFQPKVFARKNFWLKAYSRLKFFSEKL